MCAEFPAVFRTTKPGKQPAGDTDGSFAGRWGFTGVLAEAAERRRTALDSLRQENAWGFLEAEQYRREREELK